jgi:hypothetical protein
MSRHAYMVSREILTSDPPFSAIVMAAMRKADSVNAEKLRQAFPDLWVELNTRYWSPGGLMPGEDGFQFTEWRG